jgi:hypothetical protein
MTIRLTPEIERALEEVARRRGTTPETVALESLREQFVPPPPSPRDEELRLLPKINEGPSQESWERFHQLVAKRRAETLTPEEQQELIGISDEIEAANVRRIRYLLDLAERRGTTLPELMDHLGIKPPPYE